MKVTVIGLGTSWDEVTLRGLRALEEADRVYLRTEGTGASRLLEERGIAYITLDELYQRCEDFDELAAAMAEAVLSGGGENIAFAVPGSGTFGDSAARAVFGACRSRGIDCEIIPGVGWEAKSAAMAGGVERAMVLPAAEYEALRPDPRQWLLVTELDTRELAGEVKLKLLNSYPAEHRVIWRGESIELYTLDRREGFGFDGILAVPPIGLRQLGQFDFYHLCEVMDILRGPGGCPWDREQTHDSLRQYLIEEAYEAIDAIDANDPAMLADELGDILLQVAFHARIASDHGDFSIDDVTNAICSKMISRHTHIFGSDVAATSEDVLKTWDANKTKEKKLLTRTDALMDVPCAMPAAMRAQKLLKRASPVYGAKDAKMAAARLRDLAVAREMGKPGDEEAVGELLLAAVDLARLEGVSAELALYEAAQSFVSIFAKMEEQIAKDGTEWDQLSAETLNSLWKIAKNQAK